LLAQQGSCWHDKKFNALDVTLPTDGSGTLFATTHRLFVFPKFPELPYTILPNPGKCMALKKEKGTTGNWLRGTFSSEKRNTHKNIILQSWCWEKHRKKELPESGCCWVRN